MKKNKLLVLPLLFSMMMGLSGCGPSENTSLQSTSTEETWQPTNEQVDSATFLLTEATFDIGSLSAGINLALSVSC